MSILQQVDPAIAKSIEEELNRQRGNIELIASENFVSRAVLEAQGSIMTNKYAEGYPRKRYYGGCECVDIAENLARDRAKELFGAEHANVQPHSGSQANMGVYMAVLKPGDTILGMSLDHGGHLTHGSPVNFSGILYNIVAYGVDTDTGMIDYEEVRRKALECKPKMILAGASAYSRILDFKKFREIADEVGAYFMVDMAHIAGLVATGLHPNPVEHADFVTTTTHKTLRGPRGGMILCKKKYAKKIDKCIFPGIQGGPLMHIIAAKAVCFLEALQPEFKQYGEHVLANAKALAEGLMKRGFDIVSSGTENHLMLLDLRSKGVTGKVVEKVLDEVGITVNKNTVPDDPQSPFVTSGIRIGTPAVTTRGMGVAEMQEIADMIADTIENLDDSVALANVSKRVSNLCSRFPLYA